jgi:hypothetical protein
MRNKILIVFAMLVGIAFTSCDCTFDTTASEKATAASDASANNAFTQIPVPAVTNFSERKTVAQWVQRWDKPAVVTYIYIVSYGNILGYYVCNGKPVSTNSYLVPEQTWQYAHGSYSLMDSPDLDGTYGDNNPGIRFFTAEGTAVEWGGSGASYIFSDQKLPLNVPKLNFSK